VKHPKRELPVVSDGAVDRRHALKVMAIAATAPGLMSCGPSADEAGQAEGTPATGLPSTPSGNPLARGTPTDPDLQQPVVPWGRILSEDELQTLAALCDVILPEDDVSPSASALGVHDFIDEWVSAPYPRNDRDRILIRGGLVWLDAESGRRFGTGTRFRNLAAAQQRAICDDICYEPDAAEAFRAASRFFARVRDLSATGFYTTDEGMADIGYVGNRPQPSWGPPPAEVLRRVGLAPTAVEG
jgi:gluconate 2-dehydrogenase gamma chain